MEVLKSIMEELDENFDEFDQLVAQITNHLDHLSHRLERDPPSTVQDGLDLLNDLRGPARSLSEEPVWQLRGPLGDEQARVLAYWLERPIQQIKQVRMELDNLKHSTNSALQTAPSDRLKELHKNEDEHGADASSERQLLERWKKQMQTIRDTCDRLVADMDFSFLYNEKRDVFSIGYSVENAEPDKGFYDLLASEARLASFIAIAKGDVPKKHWFRLSRRLTSRNGEEFLLSWGGTTFEYLMPHLFLTSYPNTLLSHTNDRIVNWQQDYAEKFQRPWGFSESAYNSLDRELQYQYRSFGVPGLGLKRGLAEDYVVAPYASMLSLMIDPEAAMNNLKELDQLGTLGLKGFYDAVDFTPDRQIGSEPYKVVKTFMAHHQGMSLLAILNVLKEDVIQQYFHSDPRIKGGELLLQERIPRGALVKDPYPSDVELEPREEQTTSFVVDHSGLPNLDDTPPRVHLLSNGKLHSFITHAGTGSTRFEDTKLTSWTPDATKDPHGQFIYIRDCETDEYWSAFHQPVKRKPDRLDTWFHNGNVQTSRLDAEIETNTNVCVSSEDPIELRTITLTNRSDRVRTLELTTYAEVVLNKAEEHTSHPAFSKLFVQTDSMKNHPGLIAWRRPRSDDEASRWMFHTLVSHNPDQMVESLQFETERANFVGRGRSLMHPRAMDKGQTLSGEAGNVSDPILSLRRKIRLHPGEKVRVTSGTGRAESREQAKELAERYDNAHAIDRTFELASVYSTVELDHLGLQGSLYQNVQKLAGYILYNDARLRANENVLRRNRRQQSDLWAFDISGDNPIVLFRIDQTKELHDLKNVLKAHLLWKHRGLRTDLVILNDHPPDYADELQEEIQRAVESVSSGHQGHGEGEVFVLRTDRISDENITLLLTVASVVLDGSLPDVDALVEKGETRSFSNGKDLPAYQQASAQEDTNDEWKEREKELRFFNGFGGFSEETGEYQILVRNRPGSQAVELPPAPWTNVIANPSFGFLATERGGGYTWSENSRENKLTEWSNDPVRDPLSEAFYIRDEDQNTYWSPTPGPAPGQNGYIVSHGFGYTRYEHESLGIASELVQFVPERDPVKISKFTIRNNGKEPRRLTLFSYQEWVLGIHRAKAARYVVQEASADGQALFAYNHYNNEFADRVAFAASVVDTDESTEGAFFTDRDAFIGRNKSLRSPRAVTRHTDPDNDVKTGGDPCASFKREITLEPGEEQTWIVLMGQTSDRENGEQLIQQYQSAEQVEQAFRKVTESWEDRLNRIRVHTPDDSLNQMMNGWLMYQNIACRMWSRTGFYQAGGAYGFRDQLQDAMAAFYSDPDMTRDQILLHASRQFPEGDVQHWWHPPTGRGVRTNISDDKLWLPYVVDFYIESSGDLEILNEEIPYLDARALDEREDEAYLHPETSSRKDSLYEHCERAIDDALETGEHGLPLIGTGDWNDGMNRVGHEGKGESVWLGFFLHTILKKFTKYSHDMGDTKRAETYEEQARALATRLNDEGWDGKWFLRAFYDDGTPMGSAKNEECRIDAISQAWSVISEAANPEKGRMALEALEEHLISKEDQLIRLLTPPFDQSDQDPGYIKGYVPGVRENGGQYTHAATWAIKAFAESGFGNKAVEYMHMINPINHALNQEKASVYKAEPYAVAADIYGESPLVGRGGWTWYTGSAGWMYRVTLESILGVRVRGDTLIIQPAISSDWDSYSVDWTLRDGETVYEVEVGNPSGLQTGALEGTVDDNPVHFPEGPAKINLEKDQQRHVVDLRLISTDQDLQ